MSYSKPQVTIDLDEYNELKQRDVSVYGKAIHIIFHAISNLPDYHIAMIGSDNYKTQISNHLKAALNQKGIDLVLNMDRESFLVKKIKQ